MICIICDIVNKRIPATIVHEDDLFITFLDIKPLFLGHCLVTPKQHYETLYDLPRELNAAYLNYIKTIGRAVEQGMKSQGSFVAMNNTVSQSVPHLHTHIVPRTKGDGLKGFFWPRKSYRDQIQKEETAILIRQFL